MSEDSVLFFAISSLLRFLCVFVGNCFFLEHMTRCVRILLKSHMRHYNSGDKSLSLLLLFSFFKSRIFRKAFDDDKKDFQQNPCSHLARGGRQEFVHTSPAATSKPTLVSQCRCHKETQHVIVPHQVFLSTQTTRHIFTSQETLVNQNTT